MSFEWFATGVFFGLLSWKGIVFFYKKFSDYYIIRDDKIDKFFLSLDKQKQKEFLQVIALPK